MIINFTDKELQVIQLIVPDMTPEDACNKVLRDWFNANLGSLKKQVQTDEQVLDQIIAASLDVSSDDIVKPINI